MENNNQLDLPVEDLIPVIKLYQAFVFPIFEEAPDNIRTYYAATPEELLLKVQTDFVKHKRGFDVEITDKRRVKVSYPDKNLKLEVMVYEF